MSLGTKTTANKTCRLASNLNVKVDLVGHLWGFLSIRSRQRRERVSWRVVGVILLVLVPEKEQGRQPRRKQRLRRIRRCKEQHGEVFVCVCVRRERENKSAISTNLQAEKEGRERERANEGDGEEEEEERVARGEVGIKRLNSSRHVGSECKEHDGKDESCSHDGKLKNTNKQFGNSE